MSTRPPPQVELIRPDTANTLSADLVDPPAGHDAAELDLLGERDDVGLEAELLVGPGRAGQADPGLHLVEHEQRVVARGTGACIARRNSGRMWLSPPSPWIGSARKQAMSCGLASNAARAWASARASACLDLGQVRLQREPDRGHVDPRPVELGEPGGLARLGVGQRQRVAGPAVERAGAGAAPWCPARASGRAASLRRLFQSNAVFSAFSTASAPPSTKNRCGRAGSPSTRANVSTNSRVVRGVHVRVGGLVRGRLGRARPGTPGRRPARAGWTRAGRRRRTCRGRGTSRRRWRRRSSSLGWPWCRRQS